MTFEKWDIKDRKATGDNKYKYTMGDGTTGTITLDHLPTSVIEQGTPINKKLLQRYEDELDRISKIIEQPLPDNRTRFIVTVTSFDGTNLKNTIVIRNNTTGIITEHIADDFGNLVVEVDAGYTYTFTIILADTSSHQTPTPQNIVAVGGKNIAVSFYLAKKTSTIYGVKIPLNSSNAADVTYIEDAVGFTGGYMNFQTDRFVYNGWDNRFPFNQIRPVAFPTDGNFFAVEANPIYLNPNDLEQDINGGYVDISSVDFITMVEFPAIYYKITSDSTHTYFYISDTPLEGFLNHAMTYGSIEQKNFYAGAFLCGGTGNGYSTSQKGLDLAEFSQIYTTSTALEGATQMELVGFREDGRGAGQIEYLNVFKDTLMKILSLIMFKTRDIKGSLGKGRHINGHDDFILGKTSNKGMCWGDNSGLNSSCFLFMEDYLMEGVPEQGGTEIITNLPSTKNSGHGEVRYDNLYSKYDGDYMNMPFSSVTDKGIVTEVSPNAWFLPKSVVESGAANSYYCSYSNLGVKGFQGDYIMKNSTEPFGYTYLTHALGFARAYIYAEVE